MNETPDWDCIVVGGGAAGLSAALVLGRARRRTLVVDAGRPSNRHAHGIGGLLGHDGRPPAELYAHGREELARYPSVVLRVGEVVGGEPLDGGFVLRVEDTSAGGPQRERTRRVLLATGMDYQPPELPGLAELVGRSVFFCPFCHGWEFRDRPLAVLNASPFAAHLALLLRNWSDDVVLLTDGPAPLDAADRERLSAAGVRIEERQLAGLVARDGELREVAFAEGEPLPRAGLLVHAGLRQRSTLAAQLGATAAEPTPMATDAVTVDGMSRTTAPGVFAAGDVVGRPPLVANVIAGGASAGAMVVQSLVAEEHGLPFPPGR